MQQISQALICPKYAANPEPVQQIQPLPNRISHLRHQLGWPIALDTVADHLTFDRSACKYRLTGGSAPRLQVGAVQASATHRIRNRRSGGP
jgi:hypothetical protein